MTTASRSWPTYVEAFNTTIGSLAEPMALDSRPSRSDVLRLVKTTNNMTKMLNDFASEVTRVSLDLVTQGAQEADADEKLEGNSISEMYLGCGWAGQTKPLVAGDLTA